MNTWLVARAPRRTILAVNEFLKLLRDRLNKAGGLYASASYWDRKARDYQGLARSNWPSNAYNTCMHARQMEIVDRIFPAIGGLTVADVGCGTGRASFHLARRGALVTGLDFSELALAAAAREAKQEGVDVAFRRHDVLGPTPRDLRERFDAALTIGCLGIACRSHADLERALSGIAGLLHPGGRALLLEPIHRSRALRRMLRAGVSDLVRIAATVGLGLEERSGILFVPARYALAFQELPQNLVNPLFDLSEQLVDRAPVLERLTDYKVLLFRRA